MTKKLYDILALESQSSGRKSLIVHLQNVKKSTFKKQLKVIKRLKIVTHIGIVKYSGEKSKFTQYSRLTPKSKWSKVKLCQ